MPTEDAAWRSLVAAGWLPCMHSVEPRTLPPLTDRSIAQEEKRRQILDAAVRTFALKGYHATRVGDIAEEAGVAYGLVYHYFDSKEDVLETIFRETWTELLEAISAVEESAEPASEQLRQVTAILLRSWRRQPDLVRVLVREVARSPEVQRRVDELGEIFRAIERIVARGQAAGEFRNDVEPQLASWILYGAIEEILTGWVLGQLADGDAEVARAEVTVVAIVTGGLRAS
jgi:TetR/AcrR family transcriptional regulator, fatty acid metabolism regulator protein